MNVNKTHDKSRISDAYDAKAVYMKLSSNIGGSYIFINFEDLCKSSAEKFLIQD
jgi:hypothetical protein